MGKSKRGSSATLEKVGALYEKWVYPLPIMDLSAPEQKHMLDGGDPDTHYSTYWPNKPYRKDLDILVAGCGSNAAARYAYLHPEARVVGIDISTNSLAHEEYLKKKHQLHNLTLHKLPLEEVGTLGQAFDYIDTCGVIHHLHSPAVGMKALRDVLRLDGSMFVMLYSKYGRTGVYMLQELIQKLGIARDEAGIAQVKSIMASLKPDHYFSAHNATSSDLTFDAGIADMLLHPQDKAFTVAECLSLLEESGMTFQGWRENFFYYPEAQILNNPALKNHIAAMPDAQQWQVMELYHGLISKHSFFACRDDRPEDYRFTFEGDEFLTYMPRRRIDALKPIAGGGLHRGSISRVPFPPMGIEPAQAAIWNQFDGQTPFAQCMEQANIDTDPETLVEYGRNFLKTLWHISYVHLHKPQH